MYNTRVAIFVQGATVPVWVSVRMRLASAEAIAERKREEIRRNGSTHVVRLLEGK